MKVLCPKLGIEYHIIGPGNAKQEHPIFTWKLNKLIIAYPTESLENQVIILAGILNHFQPVWTSTLNLPVASRKLLTHADKLIRLASSIDFLPEVPKFVIDSTTNSLTQLPNWLESVQEALNEQKQLASAQRLARNIARKEEVIEKLLHRPFARSRNKVAKLIADWAEVAADFPQTEIWLDTDTVVTTAHYWKEIIKYSVVGRHRDLLESVDLDDLQDLIDYLELQLPHGTLHAAKLMQSLRDSVGVIKDLTSPQTEPLVPESGPKREEFTSALDYVRAKIKHRNSQAETLIQSVQSGWEI